MSYSDVIIVGGGISGLSAAWHAAKDGRTVLVLEQGSVVGGCLSSHRDGSGFWFEMGAHTTYNSYGGFIELIRGAELMGALVQRGPARIHFGLLRNGHYTWLTPYKVLLQLNWLEASWRFPIQVWRSKDGQTVESYYSRLIGPKNFQRVLAPFFAAVPSQRADAFPVAGPGSLFKKRLRDETVPRSFGLEGGLQRLCDALAEVPGIETRVGATVSRIVKDSAGVGVELASGERLDAARVVAATPLSVTRSLLEASFPDVSSALAPVETVAIESIGAKLKKEQCWLPECAFVVPVDDIFYSMVTRDPFPDPRHRGFAFHFQDGISKTDALARMSEILKVPVDELEDTVVRRTTLPSPRLGHDRVIRDVDTALSGEPIGVTGNFFGGLAIEDCISRSVSEWRRLSQSS